MEKVALKGDDLRCGDWIERWQVVGVGAARFEWPSDIPSFEQLLLLADPETVSDDGRIRWRRMWCSKLDELEVERPTQEEFEVQAEKFEYLGRNEFEDTANPPSKDTKEVLAERLQIGDRVHSGRWRVKKVTKTSVHRWEGERVDRPVVVAVIHPVGDEAPPDEWHDCIQTWYKPINWVQEWWFGDETLSVVREFDHYYSVNLWSLLKTRALPPLSGSDLLALQDASRPTQVKWLLEAGADPNFINEAQDQWETLLHIVAGDPELQQALLEAGADPRAVDWEGKTPLHRAAASANPETVQALVKAGADVNATDRYGKTPVHLASGETLGALLEAGADIHAADDLGRTPLHEAAARSVDVLVKAGADIHAADDRGWTPLHGAAAGGDESLVRTLLRAGADASALDRDGRSPRDLALPGIEEAKRELGEVEDAELRESISRRARRYVEVARLLGPRPKGIVLAAVGLAAIAVVALAAYLMSQS